MAEKKFTNLSDPIREIQGLLFHKGKAIKTEKWQGINLDDQPHMAMLEYYDWSFTARIPRTKEELVEEVKPHLPWAEDHFLERVGGEPLNPGEQYKNWPFFKRQKENDRHRDEEGQHSHTYMERFWTPSLDGIRFEYGNLGDVVDLLHREPLTRQAYLPIWFPEDTGVKFEGRVPCSLGYHFMVRDYKLHIFYPMRSCDFLRHFRDDIYMASRMVHWMIEQQIKKEWESNPGIKPQDMFWTKVSPGDLTMHILSMHVFAQERKFIGRDLEK